MRRIASAFAVSSLLVLGACSASGGDSAGSGSDTTAASDTTPGAVDSGKFGDIDSPCGPGNATVDPTENGGPTLKVATPTDKGFTALPGLDIELEDAAKAFIGWCNEQGGVQGVQLELVETDAALLQVPAAMEKMCTEAFAMVGGGLVFDDQEFPRFHECKMIDIPGYTVTATKAESDGKVEPVPNPSNVKPTGWLLWAKENRAADLAKPLFLAGNAVTTKNVALQLKSSWEVVGGLGAEPEIIEYNSAGEASYAPYAQQIKDKGVTYLSFIGAPDTFVAVLKALDEIGYKPNLIMNDGNFYDQQFASKAGASADGVIARTAYASFENPEKFPAMKQFLDIMAKYNPSGKIAGLGLQSFSAYLLFATAVNKCVETNNNVIERECVLKAAKAITSWTGGGLHTETNPGEGKPSTCGALMVAEGGTFKRLFPEIGSADDNSNGWHCWENGIADIPGDFGDVSKGKDPTRGS